MLARLSTWSVAFQPAQGVGGGIPAFFLFDGYIVTFEFRDWLRGVLVSYWSARLPFRRHFDANQLLYFRMLPGE